MQRPQVQQPPRMAQSTIPLEERRILGAIIPFGSEAYFLKAVDRIDRLTPVASSFRDVVENFVIDPATNIPNPKLPAGWQFRLRETDNEFVMADLIVEGVVAPAVKFTVSKLGVNNWDNDLLRNINRWLGQLELPPTDLASIQRDLPQIPRQADSPPAYIFDATSSGLGPASGETSPNNPAPLATSSGSEQPTAPKPAAPAQPKIISYDKPETWLSQEPRIMQLMNFKIEREGRTGEVILSWVKDAPLQNASMWSQQVLKSDDPTAIEQLAAKSLTEAEEIPAGDGVAKLYSLRAGDEATASSLLVASIPTGTNGMCLFVKLKSDLKMSEEEKSNLLRFVHSMRWEFE